MLCKSYESGEGVIVAHNELNIPIYRPSLGALERRLLLDAFDSSWISGRGKYIEQFERGIADFTGSRHAVAVANGTVALTLALAALNIGRDDEVVMPAYTYVACANSVRQIGAIPVFADSDPFTAQADLDDVLRRIGPRTRAVMIPHLYGYGSDLSHLATELGRMDIHLIEDCSEALGTSIRGKHVGGAGVLATYSFFGNKTITTGEGGMVTTNDDDVADMLRRLRNQGISDVDQYFHDIVAYNFRMTNLQAAIGVAQLERLETFLNRKREIAARYEELLSNSPVWILGDPPAGLSSQWLVTAFIEDDIDRRQIILKAHDLGVDLRPGFIPMYRLPMYEGPVNSFPGTESFQHRVICLPSFPDLRDDELIRVTESLLRAIEIAR